MKDVTDRIAKELKVDHRIVRLSNRDIVLPRCIDDLNPVTDYWYPHPPCLIPLFVGYGASYTGIVKHWFCERKSTFVEYTLENGYLSEIALTADQLITLVVLRMIITQDGITEEIINFCKAMNFDDYHAVDQFSVDYGDDPAHFNQLIYFETNRPFKYIKVSSDYEGDFPSSLCILNKREFLENACALEIAPSGGLVELENIYPWLAVGNNKKELFDNYLSEGKMKEAWLTLNSKNWSLQDVADGLEQIKEKANDQLFNLIADNWVAGWKRSGFINGNY